MPKIELLVVCFSFCIAGFAEQIRAEVLIHNGGQATWSFKDDGKQPAANWDKPGFDDSRWRRGCGPFGYGEDGVVTEVSSGEGDESVTTTTYFRTTFDVRAPREFTQLLLMVRADDGYVAYLNGKELHRWNMPRGKVAAVSFAAERLSGMLEQLYQQFTLSSEDLVRGNNVLAIELHQAGAKSSDLYLDVALSGMSRDARGRPFVQADAREVTRQFSNSHYLGPNTGVANGFLDGGRGMQVDEFGYAISGREIIGVDRRHDDRLRDHLRYARSDELKNLNEVDRATRIARYVDRVFTPPEGRNGSEDRGQYLADRYRSQEILLGNVPLLCGAGVCRHRSLLFKLMADDAGLNAALARGNYEIGETAVFGHAWNELYLQNGKQVIVDVMNPQPDFYFPELGEPSLRGYRTVANQPKYPPPHELPDEIPAAANAP
jgi:hypothetical protein